MEKNNRTYDELLQELAELRIEQDKLKFLHAEDLAQHNITEEELKRSREEFRGYFEMSSLGICITSPDKGWIEVNDCLCQMLGYNKNELSKMNWADLTHPDDITSDLELFNEVIAGKRDTYELDKRFIRKDGLVVYTTLSVVCQRNKDGSVNHFLASLLDITERKKIEETQLFLLKHNYLENRENFFEAVAHYLAVTLDMDYICIDELLGDKLSAKTLAIYFDGNFEDNVEYTLQDTPCGDVVGNNICCFPQGVRHIFPKDIVLQEMLAESYIGATLWDNSNKPIGLIAAIGRKPLNNRRLSEIILKLVSIKLSGELERIEAENNIRLKNEELVKVNSEKDKFFSIIAHDLKSPLHGLVNLTELMANASHKFTLDEFIHSAKLLNESANNMSQLLSNLLEWAMVQRGVIAFNPMEINLSELVSQSVSSLNQTALQKNIKIQNEVSENQSIYADEKMISTVFRNLVSNAVKFTKSGGIVKIKSSINTEGMTEVSVIDTGLGIPEGIINRLFKLGENVGSKGTDGEPSTGLGLILCKEFIDKHKGSIWVKSKEGEGSTFSFTVKSVN